MYKMTPQQQALTRLYRRGNLLARQLTPGDNDTLRELEAVTKQITAAVDDMMHTWPLSPELAAKKAAWMEGQYGRHKTADDTRAGTPVPSR